MRRKVFPDVHTQYIKADFSRQEFCKWDEISDWIDKGNSKTEEIIFINTTSTIEPIEAIGEWGVVENISINVTSQVCLIDSIVYAALKDDKPLRIIHMDSGAAYRPIGGWGLYCSAKAYMSMFLRVLKTENPGIKIVLFDPGTVNTNMQRKIRESQCPSFKEVMQFRADYFNGKLNSPDDVAEYIISSYIERWNENANMKGKYEADSVL